MVFTRKDIVSDRQTSLAARKVELSDLFRKAPAILFSVSVVVARLEAESFSVDRLIISRLIVGRFYFSAFAVSSDPSRDIIQQRVIDASPLSTRLLIASAAAIDSALFARNTTIVPPLMR